jgi:hypothetical protein
VKGETALEEALLRRPHELPQEQEAKSAKNIHGRTSNVREPSDEDWANVLPIARNKASKSRIIKDKYYQPQGEKPATAPNRFAIAPGRRCGIFGGFLKRGSTKNEAGVGEHGTWNAAAAAGELR